MPPKERRPPDDRYDPALVHFARHLVSHHPLILPGSVHAGGTLPDTGQTNCYDAIGEIPCPANEEPFHGQDGTYRWSQSDYEVSSDGLIVSDLNTGLMWQHFGHEKFNLNYVRCVRGGP